MSRPYFFNIPNNILFDKSKYIDDNNVKLWDKCWLYPNHLDRFGFDFDLYQKYKKFVDNKEVTFDEFHTEVNANWVYNVYMNHYFNSLYDATIVTYKRDGLNIKMWYSYKTNMYYFYTVNIFKRKHAEFVKDYGKFYVINVYSVKHKDIHTIFGNNKNTLFEFIQYPSGLRYKKYIFN